MIEDLMKNRDKKNIVMINSQNNMKKKDMNPPEDLLVTEKTTDIKMTIAIRIKHINTKKTTGKITDTRINPDIALMIETKTYLTKKFRYKVANLLRKKNLPLFVKQWMLNSIDTWFTIL